MGHPAEGLVTETDIGMLFQCVLEAGALPPGIWAQGKARVGQGIFIFTQLPFAHPFFWFCFQSLDYVIA